MPPRRERAKLSLGTAFPASAARDGFTLTELLVAMAIFISIMTGITLLFIGSTRTSQQGFQNQEAFEIARGAMNLMRRDLSRAFTSRQHGDFYNFYGTPIGFTFVGLSSPNESDDPNVARVTYVVMVRPGAEILTDLDEGDRPIYDLIRFVEPGAEDLDSLPVDWTRALDGPIGGAGTLQQVIDQAVAIAVNGPAPLILGPGLLCPDGDPDCTLQVENAMRRELWIRMLSRMEVGVLPDIWGDPDVPVLGLLNLDPLDYILAENVLDEYIQVDPNPAQTPGAKIFQDLTVLIPALNDLSPFDPRFPTYPDSSTIPFFSYATFSRAEGTITNATNAAPIVITSADHRLSNGDRVHISTVQGNTAANNVPPNYSWTVTVLTPNAFELRNAEGDDSIGNGGYTGAGVWVDVDKDVWPFWNDRRTMPVTGLINNATNATPIRINSFDHGLTNIDRVVVANVEGNAAANNDPANTVWTISVFDADNFDLDFSIGNGAYTGGGFWTSISRTPGFGSPLRPHLPEQLIVDFTLFFQSPSPGAPDFERTFDQQIDIPGGYQRFSRIK